MIKKINKQMIIEHWFEMNVKEITDKRIKNKQKEKILVRKKKINLI